MEGTLLYDGIQQCYVILTDNDSEVALHCGDCLAIRYNGAWIDTRLEMDSDDEIFGWIFIGVGCAAPLIGHAVRFR